MVSRSTSEVNDEVVPGEPPSGSEEAAGVIPNPGPQPFYVAGEGFLRCVYGDDAMVVPLPGLSLEQVQRVARGLEAGQVAWADFLDVGSGSFQAERHGEAGLGAALGTVGGHLGSLQVALVSWFRLLVILWALVGVARGDEGAVCLVSNDRDLVSQDYGRAEDAECLVDAPRIGCDGSTLWLLFQICGTITLWELARVGWAKRPWRRNRQETRGVQTDPLGIVPLPLSEHVPRRAQVLFCLWKAGYHLDTECYPEKVQIELDGLMGSWLSRLEDGEVSETSSG